MTLPLVSIFLVAYNQEDLITEAVESLLAQTYSPLEIILSDDASADNTFDIMQSLVTQYDGKHLIILNRNKTNQGLCSHINTLLDLTHGELVFCAAGDDISLPDRCSKVVSFWLQHNKKADLIATDSFQMNFNGEVIGIKKTDNLVNWHSIEDWFVRPPFILGANHTWSRNLINRFGKFDSKIRGEDQIMTFRAILTGSAMTLAEPLIKHRLKGEQEKTKNISAQYRQQEIINGNINSMASIKQHLIDAIVVGKEKEVELGFKKTQDYDQFIATLFENPVILNQLKITLNAKYIPFFKRIRLLTYAAFPWLLSPYFLIKKLKSNVFSKF